MLRLLDIAPWDRRIWYLHYSGERIWKGMPQTWFIPFSLYLSQRKKGFQL